MKNAAYIVTQSGVSIVFENKAHDIPNTHPNYKRIIDVLRDPVQHVKLRNLLDIPAVLSNRLGGSGVTVVNEQVLFNGQPVHGVVSSKILQFMREGLPFKPLVNFLNNLMANPSKRAVDELYSFLEHNQFPIDQEGCFIAYKGVRNDYRDKHSGTFDNSVGQVLEMPRNSVDEDKDRHCSYGFHVGTLEYASNFVGSEGRVMYVRVNPADAVSVPADHNAQKLRVCRYEVIGETFERAKLSTVTFGDVEDEDDWNDFDDEYYGDDDDSDWSL